MTDRSARRTVLPAPPTQPRLPVLALFDIVGGWWSGLERRCQHGACDGRMVMVPPALRPGRIECLSCGRETAEVVNEIRPREAIDLTPSRRGRLPKERVS